MSDVHLGTRHCPAQHLAHCLKRCQSDKVFLFKNFKFALAFTNAVGAISEAEVHHPGLHTAWAKVTVTWCSHSIKGLHRNDFIMAARTDEVAKDAEGRK